MTTLNYTTERIKIPDGSIMLSAGRGIAASIIRLFTKSAYSHCGILFWIGMNREHLMLVEAVDQGVQIIRFSNYLERAKKSKRSVWYGVHPGVNADNVVAMKNRAIHISGKPYDYTGLLEVGADMVFDMPGESDAMAATDKYICSRAVLEILMAGGVKLNHDFGYITPDGISKSIEVKGRFV